MAAAFRHWAGLTFRATQGLIGHPDFDRTCGAGGARKAGAISAAALPAIPTAVTFKKSLRVRLFAMMPSYKTDFGAGDYSTGKQMRCPTKKQNSRESL